MREIFANHFLVQHVPSCEQPTDLFTKPIAMQPFVTMRNKLSEHSRHLSLRKPEEGEGVMEMSLCVQNP